jgi:hypothetical protein
MAGTTRLELATSAVTGLCRAEPKEILSDPQRHGEAVLPREHQAFCVAFWDGDKVRSRGRWTRRPGFRHNPRHKVWTVAMPTPAMTREASPKILETIRRVLLDRNYSGAAMNVLACFSSFFRLARETPEITEKLWGFAQQPILITSTFGF